MFIFAGVLVFKLYFQFVTDFSIDAIMPFGVASNANFLADSKLGNEIIKALFWWSIADLPKINCDCFCRCCPAFSLDDNVGSLNSASLMVLQSL